MIRFWKCIPGGDELNPHWIIAGAAILYCAVHSVFAMEQVKVLFYKLPRGERWYRLVYNFFAILLVVPLVRLVVQNPGLMLWEWPGSTRWVAFAIMAWAFWQLVVALSQTGSLYFLGIQQLRGRTSDIPFTVAGWYKYMRHPVYFFSLLLLWLAPKMGTGLFVLNSVLTVYFFIGSRFEERRLLREFGEVYRKYQRDVPFIFPIPTKKLT